MKKTTIEEYDNAGKLIKKTTIEEDSVNYNGMYNPYGPYNPIAKPTITPIQFIAGKPRKFGAIKNDL